MQEWLLAQNGAVIYLSLFLLLMGGAIGLPIPEDIPLLLGGILIQLGKSDPFATFLVCYIAVVSGDILIFSIGRYFGPKIFKLRYFDKRETKTRLKRIRLGVERRSVVTIFVARHLFYVRTLTFLSCGALRMKYSRFIVADLIAAFISVPLMLILGYFAAGSFDHLSDLLSEAKFASLIIVILMLIGGYGYYKWSSRTKPGHLSLEERLLGESIPDSALEELIDDSEVLKPLDTNGSADKPKS